MIDEKHSISVNVTGELTGVSLSLVTSVQSHDYSTVISNKIIILEDAIIRKSLIKLGWTPPSSSPD